MAVAENLEEMRRPRAYGSLCDPKFKEAMCAMGGNFYRGPSVKMLELRTGGVIIGKGIHHARILSRKFSALNNALLPPYIGRLAENGAIW